MELNRTAGLEMGDGSGVEFDIRETYQAGILRPVIHRPRQESCAGLSDAESWTMRFKPYPDTVPGMAKFDAEVELRARLHTARERRNGSVIFVVGAGVAKGPRGECPASDWKGLLSLGPR